MDPQEETQQDQTPDPISESAHLCSPNYSVEAVILYPSLGMPMVLGPKKDQKPEPKSEKYSLIIATGEKALSLFDVQGKEREAMGAYVYIDQYLHLTPIDKPKYVHARKEGGLCKAGTAQDSIHVWHLGEIKDGMLVKHGKMEDGKRKFFPFAVLASRLFGLRNPCVPFDPADIYAPRKPCEPKKPYEGITHLWEVEIDLLKTGLIGGDEKITSDKFMNWAWLVKTTGQHRSNHAGNFFLNVEFAYHEPQDRMIDDYLRHLVDSDKHYDPAKLFEVNLLESATLPGGKLKSPLPQALANEYVKRLQSWHPVIRATEPMLKLAHLTDMHVNVRHDILASSEARMIDDVSENTVGDKVMLAFWAFKELIEEMAKKKKGVDTALLLTGDYIDFNRNIVPDHANPNPTIGKQWKDFNILAYAEEKDNTLYQRGTDNTLVYSLVRYAYTKHKMPVFMVSGNHEPYQFPYGVSPRKDGWSFELGVLEFLNLPTEKHKKKWEEASRWVEGKADERIPADHNLTIYEATLAYGPTYTHMLTTENFNANQFDWFHTLFTPFSDAVLTLGSETTANDTGTQQILALLGWGNDENYINFWDKLPLGGVDVQGAGILPRAKKSFSKAQKALLARAKALKGGKATPFVVVSHFPMVSYKLLTAFDKELTFSPRNRATGMPFTKEVKEDAAFNDVNEGTCELNQHWFYQDMVFNKSENVDWHISGHSHRAGVYHVKKVDGSADISKLQVVSAHDPDLQRDQNMLSEKGTHFMVSGSAGPLGKQNLKGEFGGWMTRPPSGSWIDVKKNTIEQVKVVREKMNEKPRLCVILDYMVVMEDKNKKEEKESVQISHPQAEKLLPQEKKDEKEDVPIRFSESHDSFEQIKFTISKKMVERGCLNLDGMKIWLFQKTETKKEASGIWHKICRKEKEGKPDDIWHKISGPDDEAKHILNLSVNAIGVLEHCLVPPSTNEELQKVKVMDEAAQKINDPAEREKAEKRAKIEREEVLKRARNSTGDIRLEYVLQAFCEIPLNKPKNVPGYKDETWDEDLNWTDPWIFPLEIGIVGEGKDKKYYFRRPFGEKGEVPDWWFRAKYFGDKYIKAHDAILNEESASTPESSDGSENPFPVEQSSEQFTTSTL